MRVINDGFEMVPVDKLSTFPGNPRAGDIAMIRESIRTNGFYGSVGVQRSTGLIVWGNHRFLAARDEGATDVPVTWVDCSDVEARRILAVDNRSNDLADYDQGKLAELLASFEGEFSGTGYAQSDLDALLAELSPAPTAQTESGAIPEPPAVPVTRPGDLWLLGPHRVLCGDARVALDVGRLVGHEKVAVAFTSPPYADRRKYDEGSGFTPIPPEEYVGWFDAVQANVAACLAPDGSWFLNIKPHCEDGQRVLYVNDLVARHVRSWGWMFVDEFCWVDSKNGVPGGWPNRFKDAWEPVFHFSRASTIRFNPLANGTQSDAVFDYSSSSARSGTGSGLLGEKATDEYSGVARPSNVLHIAASSEQYHSAAFPVGLPAWFIRSYSNKDDVVFDPFGGSGSTMVACHTEGRSARTMDLSPGYVDVMCRRYQEVGGGYPFWSLRVNPTTSRLAERPLHCVHDHAPGSRGGNVITLRPSLAYGLRHLEPGVIR